MKNLKDRLNYLKKKGEKYAAVAGFQLGVLTDRKQLLLSCFCEGLDKVSIPKRTKESWANWCYTALLMVDDDESDLIAQTMGFSFETYLMAYATSGLIAQTKDPKKKKSLQVLLASYNKIPGKEPAGDFSHWGVLK